MDNLEAKISLGIPLSYAEECELFDLPNAVALLETYSRLHSLSLKAELEMCRHQNADELIEVYTAYWALSEEAYHEAVVSGVL